MNRRDGGLFRGRSGSACIEGGELLERAGPKVAQIVDTMALEQRRDASAVSRVKGHQDFPVGGQLISLRVDRLCPCWRSADLFAGQVSGVTPFPAVASASRRLVPSVRTRWAWWRSRSTVAVARVLGMIVSNPLGCRLEVTIRDRRS
jgi:hypothetical protein